MKRYEAAGSLSEISVGVYSDYMWLYWKGFSPWPGISPVMSKRPKEHKHRVHRHADEMHESMREVTDLTVGIVKVGAVTQLGMGMLGAMNPKP